MVKGGRELHRWFFPTRTFRSMIAQDGGTDDPFARAKEEGFGAFTLARNCSDGPWGRSSPGLRVEAAASSPPRQLIEGRPWTIV
jgi:hypothetical protein